MPKVNPARPLKDRKGLKTAEWSDWSDWSDWELTNDGRRWQRYRQNSQSRYEYEYNPPESDESTAVDQPYAGSSIPQPDQTLSVPDNDNQLKSSCGYDEPVQYQITSFYSDITDQSGNPYESLTANPWTQPQSHQDLGKTTQQNPRLDIVFFDRFNSEKLKVALMDTGAIGLWIAYRIVEELGLPVNSTAPAVKAIVGNNEEITSIGTVMATWRVLNGTRTHTENFNIFDSEYYDVILGMDYLGEKKVVGLFDLTPLMPLQPAAPESPYNQAKRKQAQQEQQQGAAQSERRKKESESKKAEKKKNKGNAGGSSSTGYGR